MPWLKRSVDDNELKVSLHEGTAWLSQSQMIVLFELDQSVISRHIHNVFEEAELEQKRKKIGSTPASRITSTRKIQCG